jgi:hypothetical protein
MKSRLLVEPQMILQLFIIPKSLSRLREKKLSRNGALKVLDFALSGPDGKDNCNKFVDILGLRTVSETFREK